MCSLPWIVLLILAAFLRLMFILKGDIAFRSDDAILCDYLHKWGTPLFVDCASNWRVVDGIRLAWGLFCDRLAGSWLYGEQAAAVSLNLLGCALWVLFVYRKFSVKAAWAMAVSLAIFPLAMVYYSTVYERRTVSILLGAVLALGFGGWTKNHWRIFTLGFFISWGLWEEKLFLFFIPAVLWIERPWGLPLKSIGRVLLSLSTGLLVGAALGFFHGLQMADFPEVHMHYGLASGAEILKNLKLLQGSFPLFWTGRLPFGYLQASG